MKKKKLKVQVAALAMTGAIAAAPLTVRAEEASTAAPATASTSSTEASATAVAPAAITATNPAVSGTTSGASTATASTPATGTAATAETGATATGAGSGASTGTSTEATAGTGATASTGTAATATTEASAPTAPVTVAEAPADPATTVPNNVDTVVPDDNKQGTDISYEVKLYGFPLGDPVKASVTAEDAKSDKTLGESNPDLGNNSLSNLKAGDVVMQGDLSIQKEGSTEAYDSTATAAHDVNREDSYSLKADLDVTAVNNSINASSELISNAKDVYVNNLRTGLRSTFTLGNDLDGSFHLPTDLEDAKKHYELSSADGSPMIYRINYGKSSFEKNKVSIAMDLDLTNMTPLVNQYSSAGANYKNLYGTDPLTGKANHMENFNHTKPEHDTYYQTSVFGNLKELINNSAKKIQLVMKGVKLNSASANRVETETENEKTTTTEGTIHGTLVGYMKATTGTSLVGDVSYVWGAIQNDAGRDSVTGQNNDKVNLTVKFSTTEKKEKPVDPVQPENPAQPVTPVAPSNGGGNTPSLAPARPSSSTPSNPGTVLGESRPTASTPSGEVLGENRETPVAETVEKKQGAVLGESRPSVKGVSDRASVATGDYNFTGLWASLFGISLASLAGFVVLQKKKEN